MFIWDFVAESVMGQVLDWIYSQLVGFLGDFFAQMGNMGAELFEMEWVQGIVLFFTYLAWALYMTGLLVAVFECAIEAQHGRGSIQDTALNAIKGFMAVSLFSVLPVVLEVWDRYQWKQRRRQVEKAEQANYRLWEVQD